MIPPRSAKECAEATIANLEMAKIAAHKGAHDCREDGDWEGGIDMDGQARLWQQAINLIRTEFAEILEGKS